MKLKRTLSGMVSGLCITIMMLSSDFSGQDISSTSVNPRVLHVGFSAAAFTKGLARDAEIAIEALAESLSRRKEARYGGTSTVIYDNNAAIETALKMREIDLIGLLTPDFLDLEPCACMVPAMVASFDGGIDFELVMVVPAAKDISDIREMRNSRIILDAGNKERVCDIWLDVLLHDCDPPDKNAFFQDIRRVEKPTQAILPVFFNQFDACITTRSAFETTVELNPQVGESLKILRVSEKLVGGLICLRKGLAEDDSEAIIDQMVTLHEEPEGQQVLLIIQMEKFVPFQPSYLDTTRRLMEEHARLCVVKESRGDGDRRADLR